MDETIEIVVRDGGVSGGPGGSARPPGSAGGAFDPYAAAQKAMEASQRRMATEQARLELDPDYAGKRAKIAKDQQNRQMIQIAQAVGGGGAGGAAALGTGAAAAGGAVGIALAVKAVADAVKQAILGGIQAVGQAGGAVAGLNTGGAFDAMNKVISHLPIFGDYLAAANNAFRAFIQGLDATAARLAPFSGVLSTAQAFAQIRQIEGDMRRAQLLGPGLAKFVEQRSKLEQAGQDLLAEIVRPLIPLVTKFLEIGTDALEWVKDELAESIDIAMEILLQLVQLVEGIAGGATPITNALREILKLMDRDQVPPVNFIQDLFKMASPLNRADREDDRNRAIADGLRRHRLNIPALQGL